MPFAMYCTLYEHEGEVEYGCCPCLDTIGVEVIGIERADNCDVAAMLFDGVDAIETRPVHR